MKPNVIIDGELCNYHVTEDGRVFSLNYRRTGEVKELKCIIDRYGYKQVQLWKDNKKKTVSISRLVALAYIPNPQNKPTVDHINRVRTDNRACNLRWADIVEQNNNRKEYPKNNKNSKSVMCIETGEIFSSANEVQRQLGFSQSNISRCCRGEKNLHMGFTGNMCK